MLFGEVQEALVEKLCHIVNGFNVGSVSVGQPLRSQSHMFFLVGSLWFVLKVQDVSSQLQMQLPCLSSAIMDVYLLESLSPNKLLHNLSWSCCFITVTGK